MEFPKYFQDFQLLSSFEASLLLLSVLVADNMIFFGEDVSEKHVVVLGENGLAE